MNIIKPSSDKIEYLKNNCVWHKWFAWKPVKVNGNWQCGIIVGRRYPLVLRNTNPNMGYFKVFRLGKGVEYCMEDELMMKRISENGIHDLTNGHFEDKIRE